MPRGQSSRRKEQPSNREARLGYILAELAADRDVETKELARKFAVDERTARDDIIAVVEIGKLRPRRRRGGIGVERNTYHQAALSANRQLKLDIAAHSATHFDSSGSIAASPGTTVAMCYAMLLERGGIPAVVTNSITLATEPFSTIAQNVTLVGGHYDPRIGGTTGTAAVEGFKVHKCRGGVLGVSGISEDGTLYVRHDAEVPVLEAMLESVREKLVVVADLTKLGHADPWIVGNIATLSAERSIVLVTNDVTSWAKHIPGEDFSSARRAIDHLQQMEAELQNRFVLELVPRTDRNN